MLVGGDVVQDDHRARVLVADVENVAAAHVEEALARRRLQGQRGAVDQGRRFEARGDCGQCGTRAFRPVVELSWIVLDPEQTPGGAVHVLDPVVLVEHEDRILEALEDGEVLVLLIGQGAVLVLNLRNLFVLAQRHPVDADGELDAVEVARDELPGPAGLGFRPVLLVDQVEEGEAEELGQAQEQGQGDAAGAVASRRVDREPGVAIGAVVVIGGHRKRLGVLVDRPDQLVAKSHHRFAPGADQGGRVLRVVVRLGVVDDAVDQPVFVAQQQVAQWIAHAVTGAPGCDE